MLLLLVRQSQQLLPNLATCNPVLNAGTGTFSTVLSLLDLNALYVLNIHPITPMHNTEIIASIILVLSLLIMSLTSFNDIRHNLVHASRSYGKSFALIMEYGGSVSGFRTDKDSVRSHHISGNMLGVGARQCLP